jgi:TonB family protein
LDAVESGHRASYNLRSATAPSEKGNEMIRSLTIALLSAVLCAAAAGGFAPPALGQTPAEIEALAGRTAQRVTKTRQRHIFIAGLEGCQLDAEVCGRFETSLRAALEKAIPDVHFIKRENIINILEGRGFIALDAYLPGVLNAVATSAGADILVTDTLEWQSDGYELVSEVYDAVQGKKFDQFRVKIMRPAQDSGNEPLVFKDPESGVSAIILRGKQFRSAAITFPTCERCPDASYSPAARTDRIQGTVQILETVTEQGLAEHLGVIDGLPEGLTDQALEAVRNWHFKPAIGKDGKPFAVRIPIEVTFRLQ